MWHRAGPTSEETGWHLTPIGAILAVALVVLVVLVFVDPATPVYIGLGLVVLIWAWLLGSAYPSSQARGMSARSAGRMDFGGEAERDREAP